MVAFNGVMLILKNIIRIKRVAVLPRINAITALTIPGVSEKLLIVGNA